MRRSLRRRPKRSILTVMLVLVVCFQVLLMLYSYRVSLSESKPSSGKDVSLETSDKLSPYEEQLLASHPLTRNSSHSTTATRRPPLTSRPDLHPRNRHNSSHTNKSLIPVFPLNRDELPPAAIDNDGNSQGTGKAFELRTPKPKKPRITSTEDPEENYQLDSSVLPYLWPDAENRDALPSFISAVDTGLVQKHPMPYPPDVEDNPHFPEFYHNPDEYFDWNLFITRGDLMHAPIVHNIGVECFAGLRLSALSRTSTHIGIEERKALLQHQKLKTAEAMAEAEQTIQRDGTDATYVDEVQEALLFDHEVHEHYFTYEYNHDRTISHLSPNNVTVPAHFRITNELLPRIIQGDAVYDPISYQLLDREIPFDRNMAYNFINHFCDRFIELMHLPDRPPLVVHLHKMEIFPFTVRCLYFRPNALITATRKFVLLGTEIDEPASYTFFATAQDLNPSDYNKKASILFLLNHPLLLHWYSTNGNIRHPKFSAIPIGYQFFYRSGSQQPMNHAIHKELEEKHSNYTSYFVRNLDLGQMFPHITSHEIEFGSMTTMWVERALEVFTGSTVDAPIEVIPLDQLPERITTIYIVLMPIERQQRPDRPSLTNDILIFQEPINEEDEDCLTSLVQHIALLPFTAAMYHTLTQNPHGDPKRPLKIVAGFNIWHWRWPWFDWINKTDIGVFPLYGQDRFYEMISRTAFVASPPGNGYECFRTWEALTLGSIPVISNPVVLEGLMMQVGGQGELDSGKEVNTRALMEVYRDLPVIFIDMVTDMTMANMEKWRREIYHRARHGKYKFEKLFLQYWVDRIYGHSNDEE